MPGHSLIDQLLREWDLGNIHFGDTTDEVVIDDVARGWYLGVLGERRVAELLTQLGDEWTVLHSVPAGVNGRDIDHVVIGPGGVFTINTKNHPGKQIWAAGFGVMIDGFKHPEYLQAAVREVRQARTALSQRIGEAVTVTGIVVFVDPSSVTRKAASGDGDVEVRILADRELLDSLSGPVVLTPSQVARIATVASEPDTWLPSPEPSTVGSHIALEFAALEQAAVWAQPHDTPKTPTARTRSDLRRPRAAATRPASSRAARSGSSSRRPRKKASLGEQLFTRVVVPLAAFGGLWFYLTQVVGK